MINFERITVVGTTYYYYIKQHNYSIACVMRATKESTISFMVRWGTRDFTSLKSHRVIFLRTLTDDHL